MVIALRSFTPTAYLAQQPGLLFGFTRPLCDSAGVVRRGGDWSIFSLMLKRTLRLSEQPGGYKRDEAGNDDIRRTQENAATWLNSGLIAAIHTFAAVVVNGSPSPRMNIRCWSHGGRGSP